MDNIFWPDHLHAKFPCGMHVLPFQGKTNRFGGQVQIRAHKLETLLTEEPYQP
jgi:hypothetical protein